MYGRFEVKTKVMYSFKTKIMCSFKDYKIFKKKAVCLINFESNPNIVYQLFIRNSFRKGNILFCNIQKFIQKRKNSSF